MKSKKIILITVASILIISSFGIYNYLDIKFKSKKEGLTNSLSVQITRTRLKLKKTKYRKIIFIILI